MRGMYSCVIDGVSVSAAQDLFELKAAAAVPIIIHRIEIGQDTDETSQEAVIKLTRTSGAPTSGSGGSSGTAVKLGGIGDGATQTTIEINNTTPISGGTAVRCGRRAFNWLNGFVFAPTPEERILVAGGEYFTVNLVTAPSAALTVSGEIVWEELG